MSLLLTLLSVLAVWAFLTVLVLGLLLIFKVLDGVRRSLEQITMGVRAIEKETQPLGPRAQQFGEVVAETAAVYTDVAESLERIDRRLENPPARLQRA
jgi:uncharacterized protein YoxC